MRRERKFRFDVSEFVFMKKTLSLVSDLERERCPNTYSAIENNLQQIFSFSFPSLSAVPFEAETIIYLSLFPFSHSLTIYSRFNRSGRDYFTDFHLLFRNWIMVCSKIWKNGKKLEKVLLVFHKQYKDSLLILTKSL